ncbi:MAG: hypothetical protein ACKVOE_10300 [Rickettsiales bacterium]
MKNNRLSRFFSDFKRDDSRASHLALGAILVVSILYAATIA